jgi:hypothetical protein
VLVRSLRSRYEGKGRESREAGFLAVKDYKECQNIALGGMEAEWLLSGLQYGTRQQAWGRDQDKTVLTPVGDTFVVEVN